MPRLSKTGTQPAMTTTAGPAHRVQSAVIEYGYPTGHLGHLTANEEAAFAQFKTLCQEKGYYKPSSGTQPATHDDPLLLRFLRARHFNVQDAFKQFADTEHWRKANELDQLYETIDLEHYEETRQLYPQWTGRRDRRGIPVYVYEVKHLNSKRMAAYEKSTVVTKSKAKSDGKTAPKLLRLFALYENLTRFVMPLCTALTNREYPNTPITQSNNIVDISGVGLKQFWNLRSHMQDASTLATAHYPETLDRVFIIGAPSFFPTVWSWIKKWFDPITTSKIFILSTHDMKSTLESFIDPTNIPIKYGGTLPFSWGDDPLPDPALDNVISWDPSNNPSTKPKTFPKGPIYWLDSGEEMQAFAAGSVNGVDRNTPICTLRKLPHDINAKAPSINSEGAAKERPDLMRAPTADEFVQQREKEDPQSGLQVVGEGNGDGSDGSGSGSERGSGEHTPNLGGGAGSGAALGIPSRPKIETFVTADDGRDLGVGATATAAGESTSAVPTPVPGRPAGGFETADGAVGLGSQAPGKQGLENQPPPAGNQEVGKAAGGRGGGGGGGEDSKSLMQKVKAETHKLMGRV